MAVWSCVRLQVSQRRRISGHAPHGGVPLLAGGGLDAQAP